MKKATILILAGQSNAVGVGHVQYLPKYYSPEKIAEFEAGYNSVRINYFSHDKKSNGFVPTGLNCTEQSKNTLGPEVGMAEYLHSRYPDEEFFIVKCAVGGTSMWRDWISPSCGDSYDPTSYADQAESATYNIDHGLPMRPAWLYNELVKLLRESISWLEEQGYTPTIRGFCWMQGEADACDPAPLGEYERRFTAMVKDLSAAFAPYMGGCTVVDAGISEVWPLYREMNEIKGRMAAALGGVYLDTIGHGLTTATEPEGAVDIYHYDCGSAVELGRMFAGALL